MARYISFQNSTLPSWGCFLTAELSGKIDALLRRTVSELFDSVALDFFQQNPSLALRLVDINSSFPCQPLSF